MAKLGVQKRVLVVSTQLSKRVRKNWRSLQNGDASEIPIIVGVVACTVPIDISFRENDASDDAEQACVDGLK